ncbi:MAG: hypothetical protein MRY63_06590 [Neomegalonema sp.]|nr:hypothetical protein [Neomegalonema sp.]
MNTEGLARLAGALEGKKQRDAGRFADVQSEIARLETEKQAIDQDLVAGAWQIEAGDFAAWNAFEQWRRMQLSRREALLVQIGELREEYDLARSALLRSNGEVEAVGSLVSGL